MSKELIELSVKELDRVSVICALSEGRLRRSDAAARLGLCVH